jgi:glutathione S-transferase
MKLHYDPFSPACQSVLLFCADANIPYEPVVVDLMAGEHRQEQLTSLNPTVLVPVVEDGDFVLTESATILRYLAEAFESDLYPKGLKARARVNERLDWFQSSFHREFGLRPEHPRLSPQHAGASEAAPPASSGWRRDRAERLLAVLDRHIIGGSAYLAGDDLTIADYLGSPIFAVDELVGLGLERFPNVQRWLTALRERPAWRKLYEPSGALSAAQRWDWRSGYGATTRRSAIAPGGGRLDAAARKEPG